MCFHLKKEKAALHLFMKTNDNVLYLLLADLYWPLVDDTEMQFTSLFSVF